MKRRTLGQSGLDVSAWCLGTMTYGNQTGQEDAFAQMDRAVDAGITFFDCAEMYPVAPVRAETVGDSERMIGRWLAQGGRRDKVQIATKVSGRNGGFVRDGAGFDGPTIRQTIDASLERLQTDVIDLYQLHWPERGSYHFRQMWSYDPSGQNKAETLAHMEEVLGVLEEARQAGKVRAFGLSNETAWGTCRWIDTAARMGVPGPVAMQNEYSLLCRLYDTDMAEMAVNEDVTLLAYSPLAAGLLTGKYANGALPEGSRGAINGDLGGRLTPRVDDAVAGYHMLAEKHGLDPVAMALAFVAQRPFPSIPIFGATTLAQLERIIEGSDLVLSDDVLSEIDAIHQTHPLPF
ncbi:MAG: aldo/keto reductase [Rhodobacterales bacterium]|nr:MAG: aldo/keto reductase [Rhodobacterales bacterium]